ncbi:putative nuclease HARBI1 [Neosynchiropus ocellatus]
MEAGDCVVSAGRAVLDLLEREWQPLSEVELDQRLDQAVEDLLEAELLKRFQTSPASAPLRPDGANRIPPSARADTHVAALIEGTKAQGRMAGRARLTLMQALNVRLSLTLLRERVSYRTVSTRFHVEKGNIHRIFSSFCQSVIALADQKIRWPIGQEAAEMMLPLYRLLEKKEGDEVSPLVLGVLGHTRIPLRLPAGKPLDLKQPSLKRTKLDPDSWICVELVCDHRGRLLHCQVSPGSEMDRGTGLSSKLRQNPELMPPASYLVAATGYPLTAQILTPYRTCQGPMEELFNRTLQQHLRLLDQTVAGLKSMFKRLTCLDVASFSRAKDIAVTACVLHNVFLEAGEEARGAEVEEEGHVCEPGEDSEEGVRTRDAIAQLLFRLKLS